jgi:hypothetical protein
VADFLRSGYGRAVLVNAATKLLLKQDATTVDVVTDAFRLTADERQYLLGASKGEGLLFVRGMRLALRIEAVTHGHCQPDRQAFSRLDGEERTNGVAHAVGA